MGSLFGGCPACEKCPERPCYPQVTVYVLIGILASSFIILLIAFAFGCYRLGRFRGHKRGVKRGEDLERQRHVETENVANQRLANQNSLLALTLARGKMEQGSGMEIEERLIGGGITGGTIDGKNGQPATGMLLFDGTPQSPQTPQQQRPFHGIQQQQIVPHQGTPQSRMNQIENPMTQLGFQYQSINRSSKRFNNSSEGTFII